jgi:opacity protein-like surface antigen
MHMKHLALIAAAGSLAAFAAPAQAADLPAAPAWVFGGVHTNALPFALVADYGWDDDDDDWRDRRDRRRYRERNRDCNQGRDRYWQGNDGRWRCRKDDGTVGLLVGAGVGALLGSEVEHRGDRTLGTVLGAVGGGLLGREIDRGSARCR